MTASAATKKRGKGGKRDYRFIDKDPIIDIIRTEAQHEYGDLHQKQFDKISEKSGITSGTIRNWLFGETRRPHGFNTRMVLQAIGVSTRLFRRDGTEIRIKELPK